MARKRKIEPDDPEQSARFIETAGRILTEDASERFGGAMEQILRPRQRQRDGSEADERKAERVEE